jgi:hypothetical protein
MRTTRSTSRFGITRLAAPLAAAAFALSVATAAPAMASPAQTDPAPAPAAEVCAPGVMTITRGGPTVYDGVDCTPGPAAAGATENTPAAAATMASTPDSSGPATPAPATPDTPEINVPFGTELRPAVATVAPEGGRIISDAAGVDGQPIGQAGVVVAAFAATMGLYQLGRRRQMALRTAGMD